MIWFQEVGVTGESEGSRSGRLTGVWGRRGSDQGFVDYWLETFQERRSCAAAVGYRRRSCGLGFGFRRGEEEEGGGATNRDRVWCWI